MASSSKPERIYDVFLSFRGTDLRKNFIGHLYTALKQNGVHTFIDSEELRKGDQISVALMKAIEESCIAIIIFSEDYASSWWCLEEAAKLMECKEQGDLIVFSVFYKVEPKEVRTPRESYNKAMEKHEFKFGKIQRKDESKLIQEIVKEISTYLVQTSLHVAKHLVGIDSRVAELKLMLNLKSHEDVVMVGLWGQGGIGKTTLSKALYNAIFRQFDGSCFLANVREASKNSKGLVPLQEKLLFEILKLQQKLEVCSDDRGIILIQHRLCHKKVILVLDDVDDLRQLEALAGGRNWFGGGSRIIVTTRDKHLLTCYGIDQDHVYEVKPLSYHEARELLSNHAFLTLQKLEIGTNLVYSVLNHARGLPLALEVLGSCLRGKKEDYTGEVSRIPNKAINDVLKISYDGLEENEQEIFLNVACFFKEKDSDYIKKVLDSCDVQTTIGFDILTERSLISIDDGLLQMHDLIQSMGMDIVRQECRNDPRSRSRLWRYDDVADALLSDVGDCAVKAIVLELPKLKELSIHPNAFPKMRKLRLLILCNVHISFHGPICLPNELRWMEFAGSGPWIPNFPSGQKKLVSIDMRKGNIIEVVKHFKLLLHFLSVEVVKRQSLLRVSSSTPLLCPVNDCNPASTEAPWLTPYCQRTASIRVFCRASTKLPEKLSIRRILHRFVSSASSRSDFQQLRYIKLRDCESLVSSPNISCTPNLEELKLWNCNNLVEAHELIAYHDKLQVLHFKWCPELCVFPNVLKSKNLQDLKLSDCPKLEKFPDILDELRGLKELSIRRTALKELPTSIKKSCLSREITFRHGQKPYKSSI
ncbi:hypothetical protein EUGRSUZ_E02301 [Eucalyptus grandis]|uniref:Uncharacterized protein n=2 Tax=Eucalyptus grandis TaxID=71139 RepID=A0ACC3KXP3_EUCGR|nr:hypothetical protein EUGRSUZ_E02301 [Eucalyptus grandis]